MADPEGEDLSDEMLSSDEAAEELPEGDAFRKDVEDLLMRGMNEVHVLKQSIPELKNLQAASKLKTDVVNALLSEELLYLPINIDMDNVSHNQMAYLNIFGKVMENYSKLLEHFIRSKESQFDCLLGLKNAVLSRKGIYIVPHIDKIVTMWESVLKDKIQLNAFISDLKNKLNVSQHRLAPAIAENLCVDPTMLSYIPSICTYVNGEHFVSGLFTSYGGILPDWRSNDYLEVPPYAVPDNELYKVCGRIYLNQSCFDNILTDRDEDCFVSRVCEYHIHDHARFERPVTVTMKHNLKSKKSLSKVRVVYGGDSHEDSYSQVSSEQPEYDKALCDRGPEPWFESDLKSIRVKTFHFTRFLCIGHKIWEETADTNNIKLIIIGKLLPKSVDKYQAHLRIYVHTDFHEMNFSDQDIMEKERASGFELISCGQFMLPDELVSSDMLRIRLKFTEHWLQVDDFGDDIGEKLVPLKKFVPCISKMKDPIWVAEYLLTSEQCNMTGNLILQLQPPTTIPTSCEPREDTESVLHWKESMIFIPNWHVDLPPPPVHSLASSSVSPSETSMKSAQKPSGSVLPDKQEPNGKFLWQEVFKSHRIDLVNSILPSNSLLLDAMVQEGIITTDDVQSYFNTKNERERKSELINLVERKGEEGFRKFVKVLLTEHKHLAQLLGKDMLRSWMCEDIEQRAQCHVTLSAVRKHFLRREADYYGCSLSWEDFDIKSLLVNTFPLSEENQMSGDFIYTNLSLQNMYVVLGEPSEKNESESAWHVLTRKNVFKLGECIKENWTRLGHSLKFTCSQMAHIEQHYPSIVQRANQMLLTWRDKFQGGEETALQELEYRLLECSLTEINNELMVIKKLSEV